MNMSSTGTIVVIIVLEDVLLDKAFIEHGRRRW